MIYSITYDLNSPGQGYQRIYESINTLGIAIHPLQNLWILKTQLSAIQIRDCLNKSIDNNDKLFVTRIFTNNWASNMEQKDADWILNNID